jgi:hypothetical protein
LEKIGKKHRKLDLKMSSSSDLFKRIQLFRLVSLLIFFDIEILILVFNTRVQCSCSILVFNTLSILAQYLLNTCSILAQYSLNTCSILAQYSLNTRSILAKSSLNTRPILSEYSFNTQYSILNISGHPVEDQLVWEPVV